MLDLTDYIYYTIYMVVARPCVLRSALSLKKNFSFSSRVILLPKVDWFEIDLYNANAKTVKSET